MILVGIRMLLAGFLLAPEDGTTTLAHSFPARVQLPWRRAAAADGDPRRGAIAFYQPQLLCTGCHVQGKSEAGVGPDLTAPGKAMTGAELVEAILEPSKTIRQGYETITIVTKAGKTLTGRLVEERPDAVVVREPSAQSKPVTIAAADIDERHNKGPSLMPEGLVNQLGSRRDFLDLVRYLIAIAEGGPARAAELRPDPESIGLAPLPEYENDLDHVGLITSLDAASFDRGRQIYDRVFANCHGTKDPRGHCPRLCGSLRVRSRTGQTRIGCTRLSLAGSGRCRRRPGWCRFRNTM